MNSETQQATVKQGRRLKSWLISILLSLILAIGGGMYWLTLTPSGLLWLLSTASRATDNAFVYSGASGSLLKAFRLDTFAYRSDELIVEGEALVLRWQPRRLLQGEVRVNALAIDSLQVHTQPSEDDDEPVTLPESLRLPVKIAIDKFGIRSLEAYTLGNDEPDIVLSDLALRLDSDGALHRLRTMTVALEQGKLAGSLQIAGDPPFKLDSQLVFYNWPQALGADGKSLAAIHLGGDLEQIQAALAVQDGALKGKGHFGIQPLADMPLASAAFSFAGINPRVYAEAAPLAELSLNGELLRQDNDQLHGVLTVQNSIARPLDQDGLPLKSLRSRLALSKELIHLKNIAIRLSEQDDEAGSLAGNIAWQLKTQTGSAKLQVRRLDPSVLQSTLQPAKLSGNIVVEGGEDAQQARIVLHDKALQFNTDILLSHAASAVSIEKLDVKHGQSSLTGHGMLQLDEAQPFTFEGLLKQFDVAAFADVPRSDLNADFKLTGQLVPEPSGNLDFAFKPSHFSGQPIAGQGTIVFSQPMRVQSNTHLRFGDNTVSIKGALGKRADQLTVALSAPKLAQIGFGLKGDFNTQAVLSGTIKQPGITFEANSSQLALRDEHQLAGLKAKGSLRNTTVDLDLHAQNYQSGEDVLFRTLSLALSGTQANHQLTLDSQIDEDMRARFQANGKLINAQNTSPRWEGFIEDLQVLGGPAPLKLVTRPSVRLSADEIILDQTKIAVAGGEADIQSVRWTPKRWATQGNFSGIRVRSGELPPENDEVLKLRGDWQLAASPDLKGFLRIQRESGDLVLPAEPPFALGLKTLALDLQAENRHLNGKLAVRGTHLGETTAQVNIPLQTVGNSWEIREDTPLNGELRLDIPDLSWVGSLIDEGIQSAGKLAAQTKLSGTLAAPNLLGGITGDGLSITLLDQGMQLEEGELIAHFDQDKFRLETLNFTAPIEKPSKDRLLKEVKLAKKTGHISLQGNLDLHNQDSDLTIEIDHLPLTQQADQWVVVSGNNQIGFANRILDIKGKIIADVGFIKQPKAGSPSLADDIVIVEETEKGTEEEQALKVNLDATLDLGEHFYLRASGLEGRLAGQLQLHSEPEQLLSAVGTIKTQDTRFEAYGQRLYVRRGIVNFDGPLDDPGLNILAVRTNRPPDMSGGSEVIDQPSQDSGLNALAVREGSQVEAGVEITGTVKRPKIRLVSQPEVPDAEKLSWIVLGRPPDAGGLDSAMLLGAAESIFGSTDEGVLGGIAQGLGVDELSIRQQGGGDLTDQVGAVGKRLSSRAYMSYERGLTSASAGVVKLTYSLFPNISVVTQAGDDSAVDLFYNFQFD